MYIFYFTVQTANSNLAATQLAAMSNVRYNTNMMVMDQLRQHQQQQHSQHSLHSAFNSSSASVSSVAEKLGMNISLYGW